MESWTQLSGSYSPEADSPIYILIYRFLAPNFFLVPSATLFSLSRPKSSLHRNLKINFAITPVMAKVLHLLKVPAVHQAYTLLSVVPVHLDKGLEPLRML